MKWIKNNGGRGKSTRLGRQQTDFRIVKTKTNSKIRTNTANNRRNPNKSTLTSWTNLKSNMQFEINQQNKANISSNGALKTQNQENKRTQSQHNERRKVKNSEPKDVKTDLLEEIEKFKETIRK